MISPINYIRKPLETKGEKELYEVSGHLYGIPDAIVSHAIYNHPKPGSSLYESIAHLNTLSSIRWAIKGRVLSTLSLSDQVRYDDMIARLRNTPLKLPPHPWKALIETIVAEYLPEHIAYLRIIIAEKAQTALEDYYMRVWRELKEAGKIRETSFYGWHGQIDGVCYKIR